MVLWRIRARILFELFHKSFCQMDINLFPKLSSPLPKKREPFNLKSPESYFFNCYFFLGGGGGGGGGHQIGSVSYLACVYSNY